MTRDTSQPLEVYTSRRSWRSGISSHERFTHDSIESLGHDWERVAHPDRPGRPPFKVYIATSVDDVVRAVREARELGERLTLRSKGHSSNDLVVAEGGAVLLLQGLNRVLDVDEEGLTATVQAGCISAEVDDLLAPLGLGLPVVGDHADITVGGFASVGGINAASHRHGMFVDNVLGLEYVDWEGEVHTCGPGDPALNRLLGGLGRWGVITSLTVRIERAAKYGTVLRNRQRHFRSLDRFVAETGSLLREPPPGALYERGLWLDLPKKRGGSIALGQFSVFEATRQSGWKRLRDRLSYGYLHRLGYVAGRLPSKIDELVKILGTLGILFGPRYGRVKNIEYFAEKILDSTVGDPMRMFVVLLPLDTYPETFRDFWSLMIGYRERHGCFTFVSVYLKSIASPYLAAAGRDGRFAEFLFYVGVEGERLTPELTEELVSELDDLCIRHGALRYMHSKTVKDPERVRLIDPNAYWTAGTAEAAAPVPVTVGD
ncbi:MAG: FAD-binding protein [Gaiellaceae bacterium]